MRVTELYYRVLALTLVGLIIADIHNRMWQLHTGEIFPYRHIPIFPLYGPAGLVLEWIALAIAAVALWIGVRRRAALWLAALAVLASLTQHYSNHATLTVIVLVFTAFAPPARDDDLDEPNMRLVRWQLAIVYVCSGLTKVQAGFHHGTSLANLYLAFRDPLLPQAWFAAAFRPPLVVVMSVFVVVFELCIAGVLVRWPRVGVGLVALFHGGITVMMPGILPFGLIMLTMSVLFLARRPT